eukprot:3243240-Rhodomonas_salina.1
MDSSTSLLATCVTRALSSWAAKASTLQMRIRLYADVTWKDILGKHPEQKEKKDLYTSVTGFTAKRTDHFIAAA